MIIEVVRTKTMSDMSNLYRAYSAVHSSEVSDQLSESRDLISDMQFNQMNSSDLQEVAEEILEEMFELSLDIEQSSDIIVDILSEALKTSQSDLKSQKIDYIGEAFDAALENGHTVERFLGYRRSKKVQENFHNTSNEDRSSKRLHEALIAQERKNIKEGILSLIEKKTKDSSYLETNMKKRAENNEKARKDMEKMGSMKNPQLEEFSQIRKDWSSAYYSIYEKMDPVGQEDGDIDNDGDKDKSDKYLANRRKAIGKSMGKNGKEVPNCVKEGDVIDEMAPMKHVSTTPSGQKRYSTKDDGRQQRGVSPDGRPGGVNAPRTVGPTGAKIYNSVRALKKRIGLGDDYQPEGKLLEGIGDIESIYEELIGEGYSEDDVEKAIEFALTEGPTGDIGYRAGRALRNMGGDLVKGTATSLKNLVTGTPNNAKTNPASARQQQRLRNIGTFAKTGEMSTSNSSKPTPKPEPPSSTRTRAQNRRSSSPAAIAKASSGKPTVTPTVKPTVTPTVKPTVTPTVKSTVRTAPKPAVQTALQKKTTSTNAEYDRLRKSDPAAAKKFGMAASKAKFGNQLKPKTSNPLMKGFASESVHQVEKEVPNCVKKEDLSEFSLPRSVTVIPPSGPKGNQKMYKDGGGDAAMRQKGQTRDQVINQGRKNYVKQSGDTARQDIKNQGAGKVSRVNGKIPEFRVQKNSYEPEGEVTFSEAELKAIQAKVDAWDVENEITEFVAAPAGSPIDRHSRGISRYDTRTERQIRRDNFAAKRTKMLNQPKTP